MKTVIFFGIFFLSTLNIYAQENITPFEFKDAYRKFSRLEKLNGKSNGSCESVKSTSGDEVMSCSIKDSDYQAPIVKLDFEAGKIPAEITSKLPEKFLDETKGKKVSCLFRMKMENDNQQMIGRRSTDPVLNNKYGDDFGRTHGLDVGLSCASEDGISQAFSYSTELFSKPDLSSAVNTASGIVTMKQRFTSENIFTFLQDNINQGKATYWKRGVGFINLSEKKKWDLLQSTGQQEWFHSIVNQISPGNAYDYKYVEGSRDEWGAFVILAIGLQENRKLGDRCTLSTSADVGVRVSSLKDTSTLNLNATAKFSYQVSDSKSIYLRAQTELTQRSSSRIVENTIAAGLQTNKGSYVEMGVTTQSGNRKDVPDYKNFYTGKNDRLIFVRVGKQF